VHAFAVPFHAPAGVVFGSVAVTGHAEDFSATRADQVVAAMREEIHHIEAEANASSSLD